MSEGNPACCRRLNCENVGFGGGATEDCPPRAAGSAPAAAGVRAAARQRKRLNQRGAVGCTGLHRATIGAARTLC
eukprot:7150174-Prymnesium_polylepis.2